MTPLTARQIGEIEARDFLGDETWRRWKADYDDCMAFRKSIKGAPDEYQRLQLTLNDVFIKSYQSLLFGVPACRKSGSSAL